jgi:hypothetical protein
VTELRSTVDGLLALGPAGPTLDRVGTPQTKEVSVTPDQATARLAAVGADLIAADKSYASARVRLARAAGGVMLPRSVWVDDPALWSTGAISTTVDQLWSSPTLDPVLNIELVTFRLDPSPLPTMPSVPGASQAPPLPSGAVEITPTCTIVVTAVLTNRGSVAVQNAGVQASVQSASGGPAFVVDASGNLGPSASIALVLPKLPVSPGSTYTLVIGLLPPAAQSAPQGLVMAVASFGSAAQDGRCSRTPAAAP